MARILNYGKFPILRFFKKIELISIVQDVKLLINIKYLKYSYEVGMI